MAELNNTLDAINLMLSNDLIFNKIVDDVFSSIDIDGSGTLECDEIIQFIKEVNRELSVMVKIDESIIRTLFKQIDIDGSQTIDRNEFGQFLKQMFIRQKKSIEEGILLSQSKGYF